MPTRAARQFRPGRLVHRQDFERLLATRPVQRSAHFALHHVVASPTRPSRGFSRADESQLSTADAIDRPEPVDNLPRAHWLGCLVPKRQARRAVTRNLVKRQMRAAFAQHGQTLAEGLWLLRLKAPLPASSFVSAASLRLCETLRSELDSLLQRGRPPGAPADGVDVSSKVDGTRVLAEARTAAS